MSRDSFRTYIFLCDTLYLNPMLYNTRHTVVSEVSLGIISAFLNSSVRVAIVKFPFAANFACKKRRTAPIVKLSKTGCVVEDVVESNGGMA